MGDIQVLEKEWNVHGQQILAGAIELTGTCLISSYIPYLIQITLGQHSKIFILEQFSLSESLGQEIWKDSDVLSESFFFFFF